MLSPKSPIPSFFPAPQPTHSCFLALAFPCTGAYDLRKTKGLFSNWWLNRPSSATYATRDTALGHGGDWLYHIVVPPIGLQTPLAPWVFSLSPSLGACIPSNKWLWASTSVFARHWHSLTRDSYIRVLSAKSSWKTQVTAHAVVDVEKEEHSSIAGEIASWLHSGNHSGGFSENWT